MGRIRLLDVCRHQRRSGQPWRALRFHHKPQLPRPPGPGRTHSLDVAGDGRGRGRDRPSCRRARAPGESDGVASMEKFTALTGTACPINQSNLNTDQILPARLLKWTRAMGFGKALFHDLRFDSEGREKAEFPLNRPAWRNATIVVSGRNFGCGSSREAAVYALYDFGVRCVIAPSFGDIFAGNAVQNGLLTAAVTDQEAAEILESLAQMPELPVTLDLEQQTI